MNRVIGSHIAEIDGKNTALAGCDQLECPQQAYCLRADPALAYRVEFKSSNGGCPTFIPLEVLA